MLQLRGVQVPAMTTLLALLASALLSIASAVIRPTAAQCPRHWWLSHGIEPNGGFACTYDPLTDDTDTAPLHPPQRPVIRSRLWCEHGRPRVDGVRVFCAGEEPRS